MPVYLVHGFRWPRESNTGIRVHAALNNLDDCSVDYLQNEASTISLIQSFRNLFPDIMQFLEDPITGKTLHFVEQYDPEDELSDNAVSQPFAFVADRIVTMAAGHDNYTVPADPNAVRNLNTASLPPTTVLPSDYKKPPTNSSTTSSYEPPQKPSPLSLNVEEVMSAGPVITPQAWEALAQLRDKIAEGEKIGWWVVYNGDPERAVSDGDDIEDDEDDEINNDDNDQDMADTAEKTNAETAQKVTNASSVSHGGIPLGQPLPSLIPPDVRHILVGENDKGKANIASDSAAVSTPVSTSNAPLMPKEEPNNPPAETPVASRPKDGRPSFSFLPRRKSSNANILPPRNENVPQDLPVPKEAHKKEGRRHRFFGSKGNKKTE